MAKAHLDGRPRPSTKVSCFPVDAQGRIVLPLPVRRDLDDDNNGPNPWHDEHPYNADRPLGHSDTSSSPPIITIEHSEYVSPSPSASPQPARRRGVKNPKTDRLCQIYERHEYPSEEQYHRIADKLGLDINQVKKWFMNQRMRVRKRGGHVSENRIGRPSKGSAREGRNRSRNSDGEQECFFGTFCA